VSENVVKSAARVLEVFEYFAGRRTPATVGEVCNALGYPQSSTSVLLKSLFTLGYLSYDQGSRRYSPSVKVATLGEWIPEELQADADDIGHSMASIQAPQA
jgi:DNA-binding IclR family transcriptional regulator